MIRVRWLERDDFDDCVRLASHGTAPWSPLDFEDAAESMYGGGCDRVLVAQDDEDRRARGVLAYEVTPGSPYRVKLLAIDPDDSEEPRAELLKLLLAKSSERGLGFVIFLVPDGDYESLKWLKANGGRGFKLLPGYYADGADAWEVAYATDDQCEKGG